MGNNPVSFSDPDGEWIIPVAMVAISAISGAMRAKRQGGDVADGIMKGIIIGGASAMLAPIGGGGLPFIADIGIAVGQGAAIGAMDAYLWNNDVGKSAIWGAASSAVMFTLTSPNLKNSIKGKKFKTNQNVFNDFAAGKYTKPGGVWQQDALNYFGYEGDYNPALFEKLNLDAAGLIARDETVTKIFYNNKAFESFDNLQAVFAKENFHANMPIEEYISKSENLIEYEGFVHVYENQTLYPGNNLNLLDKVNVYAKKLKLPHNSQLYDTYTIPGLGTNTNFLGTRFNYKFARKFKNIPWTYTLPRRY